MIFYAINGNPRKIKYSDERLIYDFSPSKSAAGFVFPRSTISMLYGIDLNNCLYENKEDVINEKYI
jgi:hypothetical protein